MPVHKSRALDLNTQERLKAVANDTRAQILTVLEDGPASAKQIAGMLDMSHGKIGHHMNVLRKAGLIELVEERKVRALTERIYGLTFERLTFSDTSSDRLGFTLSQAALEARPSPDQPFEQAAAYVTARVSDSRAAEFHQRMMDLINEFQRTEPGASAVYGIVGAVFQTKTPSRGADR